MDQKPKPPEPLNQHHIVEYFDCGNPALNLYLKLYAYQNQQSGGARTYVITQNNLVIGYYSLTYGSAEIEDVPERVKAGLGHYPVPLMILARLAVDKNEKGKGFGWGLLRDSLKKTLQAANIAGLRALMVHAKDEKAKTFYQKFNFVPSPLDDFHLFLLIKDIRKTIQS